MRWDKAERLDMSVFMEGMKSPVCSGIWLMHGEGSEGASFPSLPNREALASGQLVALLEVSRC